MANQNDYNFREKVDPSVSLTIWESCEGYPNGTVCTKRCIDISCDPKMARCYKGQCKRAGQHPCEVERDYLFIHPCCNGIIRYC